MFWSGPLLAPAGRTEKGFSTPARQRFNPAEALLAEKFPPRSKPRHQEGAEPSPARRQEAAAPAGAGVGDERGVSRRSAGYGQAEQADGAGRGEVQVGSGPRWVSSASGERRGVGGPAGAEPGGVRAGGGTGSRRPRGSYGGDWETPRYEEVGRSFRAKGRYCRSPGRYGEGRKVNTGPERLIGHRFQSKMRVCFVCGGKRNVFKVCVSKL